MTIMMTEMVWIIEWTPVSPSDPTEWREAIRYKQDRGGTYHENRPRFGLEEAMREVRHNQTTLPKNAYRIRNLETGDVILADALGACDCGRKH